MENAILQHRLIADIRVTFRVARYQRGYRWGEIDVTRLLDDIFDSGGKPYSLQPVVVKAENCEGTVIWELIDGQQRMTTLYLLLSYMNKAGYGTGKPPFSINYVTRALSAKFIEQLSKDTDPKDAETNIDFLHMFNSFQTIRKWFESKVEFDDRRAWLAHKIYGYLNEFVSVIWYEVPLNQDSEKLFTNLNVGRIPLTDAELVKALLMSKSRAFGGSPDRSQEIATQWDQIEHDLQNPDIWAFVADDNMADNPTRIMLLLDAMAGGPTGRARPRFYTFDVLKASIEKDGAQKVWNEVIQLHALVRGWYDNRDYYHRIGFLVATGQPFRTLVSAAKDKTKRAFGGYLDALIRDRIALTPTAVAELSYEKNRAKCSQLLLLLNVLTVRRLQDSTERYPFRHHRSHVWSLEHIHAQNAMILNKAEQWHEWLRLHREALGSLPTETAHARETLLKKIDEADKDIGGARFQALAREITEVFSLDEPSVGTAAHTLHSISNLALLASEHNSALNNAVFEVKRRRILELDRKGAYIPVCTRQVFFKYHTNADAQQVHFWSSKDKAAYLEAILSDDVGIGAYLTAEE